jgi:hypothetical protein
MSARSGAKKATVEEATAEDLKGLGVSIVGHRGKLLDAIAARRGDANEGPTSTLSQLTRYR